VTINEAALQTAMQTAIQTISAFASASVVINDWSVLDGSIQNAPYVIITTADEFHSVQDVKSPNSTDRLRMPITLVEAFIDWPTTLGNLRDRRQAIIDEINSGSVRSAGGLSGLSLDDIRNAGLIVPYHAPGNDPKNNPEAEPQFLMQTILLTYSEF
jgi:hypothetical protein